jgi:hypothetical protein
LSNHFRSPGESRNTVSDSEDYFYDNFRSSSSNENSREDQQLRSESWEQHQLLTPSSGFNYSEFQFSSGSPTISQAPVNSFDRDPNNNFYSGWKNQNSMTNSPNFMTFNSPDLSRTMQNNFTSTLNPDATILFLVFNNLIQQDLIIHQL